MHHVYKYEFILFTFSCFLLSRFSEELSSRGGENSWIGGDESMKAIPFQQQLLLHEATAHSQRQSQLPANNSYSSERTLSQK